MASSAAKGFTTRCPSGRDSALLAIGERVFVSGYYEGKWIGGFTGLSKSCVPTVRPHRNYTQKQYSQEGCCLSSSPKRGGFFWRHGKDVCLGGGTLWKSRMGTRGVHTRSYRDWSPDLPGALEGSLQTGFWAWFLFGASIICKRPAV